MHVCIWRCEHATFCVDMFMYKISLIVWTCSCIKFRSFINACTYMNDACNVIFISQ